MPLKRSIDGEREREREGEGGIKYAHRRPQVDQLLLSRVIDVKYGCFTLFLEIMKRALFGLANVAF